jgi:pimeloyl-ACP methyl ester carboxylesterase
VKCATNDRINPHGFFEQLPNGTAHLSNLRELRPDLLLLGCEGASGHNLHWERPTEVNAAIASFLGEDGR